MSIQKQKQRSPYSYLLTWAMPYKGQYVVSILTAVLEVLLSLVPYYCISRIVTLLIENKQGAAPYAGWILIAAVCWIASFLLHAVSTTVSHKATFTVIADVRKKNVRKACADFYG